MCVLVLFFSGGTFALHLTNRALRTLQVLADPTMPVGRLFRRVAKLEVAAVAPYRPGDRVDATTVDDAVLAGETAGAEEVGPVR